MKKAGRKVKPCRAAKRRGQGGFSLPGEHRIPRRDQSSRSGLTQARWAILPLPEEREANGAAATVFAAIPESTPLGQNGLDII